MNDEELRLKIYDRLGLQVGSLKSESGNDWVRAEKEILDEYRSEEFEKLKKLTSIDYSTIEKNTPEYKAVISSTSPLVQNAKIIIASIQSLIFDGNKDILISLTRNQILSPEDIDLIIPKSTYLVKKYLVENQELSFSQKEKLVSLMEKSTLNYTELINKLILNTINILYYIF